MSQKDMCSRFSDATNFEVLWSPRRFIVRMEISITGLIFAFELLIKAKKCECTDEDRDGPSTNSHPIDCKNYSIYKSLFRDNLWIRLDKDKYLRLNPAKLHFWFGGSLRPLWANSTRKFGTSSLIWVSKKS